MSIADKLTQIAENEQKVYDSGYSKAEYDWWVNFTKNNARKNYAYAFSNTTFEYLRPPFKIAPNYNQAFNQMFAENPSLKKIESKYWDFSQRPITTAQDISYSYYYTFASCENLEEVEDIGLKEEKVYGSTFSGDKKLHTIACIRVAPYTKFSNCFYSCMSLENLTIVGVIGHNSFDVHWSTKLTHDSLMSIINALADYSADTSGTTWTVTLGAENIAKLTEEELDIIDMKGWVVA